MRRIEEVLPGVKMWQNSVKICYEPLNGGFANNTYKVEVDGKFYVLRINSKQSDFLGLDRLLENQATYKAYTMGIAPKVFLEDSTSDYLITEFTSGHGLSEQEMHDPLILERIIGILKKINSITGIDRKCSLFNLIENYIKGAVKLNVKLPIGLPGFLERVEQIREYRSKDKENNFKFCHNDYFPFNMLYDGQDLKVIDWELCGYGDVFFELATLSFFNKFSKEKEKFILKTYFGYSDDEQLRILHDMKFVCMVREVAWALLYAGMNLETVNHNMDYYGHAVYVTERLEQGFLTL